jgi:cystathionine beta-lyase/cystathionine gamma-synthase
MRPLEHGADIVVQSLSKAMGGSGMTIAGAVIARHDIPSHIGPDDLRANFAQHVKLLPLRDLGPGLSPFSALMVMNDLRTLRGRVDHWSGNAMTVARWLEADSRVTEVRYPGLPSFPGHLESARYMTLVDGDSTGTVAPRFGHLMSFRVAGGPAATRAAFDRLQLIWRATDLGRVKSIATIPAISTHQQQGETGRELADIPEDLVRLSIGGEHPDDLVADLDRALGATG